jgi:hypothetical protein
MEADVLAFIFIDVHRYLLDEVDGLAIGWFESFEIGPENVVGLAGRQALFEFAVVVGIDFPSHLIGLVLAAADFDGDSIYRCVVGSPHRPNDYSVGFSSGLGCEQAIPRTEGRQENESGDNPEQ